MSTSTYAMPDAGVSPRTLARVGGFLYLLIIVGGIRGEVFIRERLIVPADATATARNILENESLWRIGVATELFLLGCAVALALILFVLLRPVSRDLSLLAAFFHLVSIAVEASNELQLVAALLPLTDAGNFEGIHQQQLHALAALSIKNYSYGFGAGLIFFGWMCLVLGYLIYKSRYIPKAIGVLLQIAGLSYLVNSFTLILSPAFASRLFPAILLPAFVAEASLCLWLLVRGVRQEEWDARAAWNASLPHYGPGDDRP